MAFVNVWHLRKVAETSSKPCDVCYKPTTSVLITPDNKDYFYVCPGHLKDRGFCTPIADEADAAAKKKKAELDREIEIIKQEYEENLKKRKGKAKKAKDSQQDKNKSKEDEAKDEEDEKAEKERDAKVKALTSKDAPSLLDNISRIYALQKVFYQKRLDKLRNAEIAKRNRERLRNPVSFPSVPTNDLA
ncbi:hypothetical protein MMC21_007546 [Puttea exsequens]|nr:hypothetical protein [Puttea exsequens]